MDGEGPGVLLFTHPFGDGREEESHRLLRCAAARYAGRTEGLDRIERGERGKPFFPDAAELHFSISHSGCLWMCAFSDRELGLDLQEQKDCDREKLSRRFFHPREDAFLRRGGYADFFRVWAAKESYVKYTGRGIADGLESFSVVSPALEFPALDGLCLRLLPWWPDWALCLCTESPGPIRLGTLAEER